MIELTIRIAFSLLIVLGLMWGLAKVVRRPLAGRGAGGLAILARQQLTKGSAVAVVRVADRALVLGVTDNGVSMLADTDLEAFEAYLPEPGVRREAVPIPDLAAAPVAPAAAPPPALNRRFALPSKVDGRLAGSLLSGQTWRQAAKALRTGGRA